MAGTGHSYEVVNAERAREVLVDIASEVGHREGRDWFLSPQLLRYVTGPDFVVRPEACEARDAIENLATDVQMRDILIRKLEDGADVRIFFPEFLERCGIDLRHVAHWMRSLPRSDPRMLRKLRKISVSGAKHHADRWVADMARQAASSGVQGTLRVVMEPRPGMLWLELEDADALAAESAAMTHCVRDYASRLGNGTRIFSLRDQRGTSLVTVELVNAGSIVSRDMEPQALVAMQVKGPRNDPPAAETRASIMALFNHLGVVADRLNNAAAVSITRAEDGTWQSVSEVAERVEIHGMPGYRIGNAVHVASRVSPDNILAIIVGAEGWWTGASSPYRMMGVEVDQALADQRALARLANDLKVEPANLPHLVRNGDGLWTPWIDTCTPVELDGVACYEREGVTYLLNETRRDVLLEAVRDMKGRIPSGRADWPASYIRRIAKVLTALKSDLEWEDYKRLKIAGLAKGPNNHWYRFLDVAVEHDYRGETEDGEALRWMVAPWRIALVRPSGREWMTFECALDGGVKWALSIGNNLVEMRDGARLLNELGRGAAPDFEFKWETKSNGTCAFAHIDGRWRVLESEGDLVAELRKLGRRQYRDRDCTRSALALLQNARGSDVDALLAGHYANWASTVGELPLQDTSWSKGFTNWTLRAAALRGLMPPAHRRKLGRAAAKSIRNVIGRSRRPGKHSYFSVSALRELVLAVGTDLPEKTLHRSITWLFGGYGTLLDNKDKRVDPRWFELADALEGDWKPLGCLAKAAESSLFALKVHEERMDFSHPDAFMGWLNCLDLAPKRSWGDYRQTAMAILAERLKEHRGMSGWEEVEARLDALAEPDAEMPMAA